MTILLGILDSYLPALPYIAFIVLVLVLGYILTHRKVGSPHDEWQVLWEREQEKER